MTVHPNPNPTKKSDHHRVNVLVRKEKQDIQNLQPNQKDIHIHLKNPVRTVRMTEDDKRQGERRLEMPLLVIRKRAMRIRRTQKIW